MTLFLAADLSFAARIPPVWWGAAITLGSAAAAVAYRMAKAHRGGKHGGRGEPLRDRPSVGRRAPIAVSEAGAA